MCPNTHPRRMLDEVSDPPPKSSLTNSRKAKVEMMML